MEHRERNQFESCESLTTLDVSNWKTDKVVTTYGTFGGCKKLETIDVSNWNTENDTIMSAMFSNCTALKNLDVSKFKTSKVTSMRYMFNNCYQLTSLDLANFNTSLVKDMERMFYGSSALTTIYCNNGWNTGAVTNSANMFWGCDSLVGGAGTIYSSSHTNKDYAHVDGGTDNPGYFTFKANLLLGDVNNDGSITIADVTALVNIILGKDTTGLYNHAAADVNRDNSITIADVTALVNIILGKN